MGFILLYSLELTTRVANCFLGKKSGGSVLIRMGSLIFLGVECEGFAYYNGVIAYFMLFFSIFAIIEGQNSPPNFLFCNKGSLIQIGSAILFKIICHWGRLLERVVNSRL